MKQIFTKLMLMGILPLMAYGQTFVSTTPENKKVILEEFTGINCVYCPQGHAIAEEIMDENEGNAFAINVHVGSFATPSAGQPDFRTPFGIAIANQTGLTGYPSGTVNRHVFSGLEMGAAGTTAMGRTDWKNAANQILEMPSYLNMAVRGSIDVRTRVLTVEVESYYTGNSPEATNFLNVALLQNNTLGPQVGGGAGDEYVHMRRLVHLVTDQWGEEITTTTEGSFVSKTYTYTIPADYNSVDVDLSEMELIVFMTETKQEIISGNGAFPTLTNFEYSNDASVRLVGETIPNCDNTISPVIEIENAGENEITSATITYSINGTEHTYNWTGNLTSFKKEVVELPSVTYTEEAMNTLSVSLPNDENGQNNTVLESFAKKPETSSALKLTLTTDGKANQTRWLIRSSAGAVVEAGTGYSNNETYNIDINLDDLDCYLFELQDLASDGGAQATLKDVNGVEIFTTTGDYGKKGVAYFSVSQLGVEDLSTKSLNIYPNPSTGIVNINAKKDINSVNVFDTAGKIVFSQSGNSIQKIDLTSLPKGVYVITVSDGKSTNTKKVLIK